MDEKKKNLEIVVRSTQHYVHKANEVCIQLNE